MKSFSPRSRRRGAVPRSRRYQRHESRRLLRVTWLSLQVDEQAGHPNVSSGLGGFDDSLHLRHAGCPDRSGGNFEFGNLGRGHRIRPFSAGPFRRQAARPGKNRANLTHVGGAKPRLRKAPKKELHLTRVCGRNPLLSNSAPNRRAIDPFVVAHRLR